MEKPHKIEKKTPQTHLIVICSLQKQYAERRSAFGQYENGAQHITRQVSNRMQKGAIGRKRLVKEWQSAADKVRVIKLYCLSFIVCFFLPTQNFVLKRISLVSFHFCFQKSIFYVVVIYKRQIVGCCFHSLCSANLIYILHAWHSYRPATFIYFHVSSFRLWFYFLYFVFTMFTIYHYELKFGTQFACGKCKSSLCSLSQRFWVGISVYINRPHVAHTHTLRLIF